jgi:hypothetical protein
MDPHITTFSGITLNPLNPEPSQIDVIDIAHHLSCINRFNGGLPTPMSVAQHSVNVSRLLHPYGLKKLGLFHDAAEAYLGDVTKWLKQTPQMAEFRKAEERVTATIFAVLVIKPSEHDLHYLEWADRLMVRAEAEQHNPYHAMFSNPKYPHLNGEERIIMKDCGVYLDHQKWYQAKLSFIEEMTQL